MSRPVMVITGGSRGIGAATARLAAAAGYDLVLSYASDAASGAEVQSACASLGAEVLLQQADVSVEAQVVELFQESDARFGRLDVLVNNAGVLDTVGPLSGFSAARMERIMMVNVVGALVCAREAAARMSTASGGRGGSIINVGSKASTLGSPNEFVDYAASKGAMDTMTIGLAKELAPEGIRTNAVRPGLIHTDIHASGGDAERVERLAANVPQGRGGTPEEVGELIVWLASPAASYVNGALIDVAGGR